MRNNKRCPSSVKCLHQLPLSSLFSHSLPLSLPLKLWLAPLSPSQPATFLHPETSSFVTKAGKDGGRQSGRNTTLSLGPPCVYVLNFDCLLIYTHIWHQRVWLWLGRPRVCRHGSMRRKTVNKVQCCGSSLFQHQWIINGPLPSAEWQRHETSKHKRKIEPLPTRSCCNGGQLEFFCMCVKQADREKEGGTGRRVGGCKMRQRLCDRGSQRVVSGVDLKRRQGKSGRTGSSQCLCI